MSSATTRVLLDFFCSAFQRVLTRNTESGDMAGGGFSDKGNLKRAHLYEYRITNYFIFACLVAAMGGSLFGYDLGVSGEFLSDSLLFS